MRLVDLGVTVFALAFLGHFGSLLSKDWSLVW
jgi:hypothetical protein